MWRLLRVVVLLGAGLAAAVRDNLRATLWLWWQVGAAAARCCGTEPSKQHSRPSSRSLFLVSLLSAGLSIPVLLLTVKRCDGLVQAQEEEGAAVAAVAVLEQRLAALEATCASSGAADSHENDIAARLDAQERAMGRAGSRHRTQIEQLELAIAQQEQRLNDTDATLQGLLALPGGLADVRAELASVNAQMGDVGAEARASELGRLEAVAAAAASAAGATAAQTAAIESAQSAQSAAVEALLQKVAALEQGNPSAAVDALTGQVEQLAKVQAQTNADIEALRQRLERIGADVEANARAAAATAEGKEIEHRVVFVPADTQEPQLKQHQRVRAT
jgi:chromosome segregation ATPase